MNYSIPSLRIAAICSALLLFCLATAHQPNTANHREPVSARLSVQDPNIQLETDVIPSSCKSSEFEFRESSPRNGCVDADSTKIFTVMKPSSANWDYCASRFGSNVRKNADMSWSVKYRRDVATCTLKNSGTEQFCYSVFYLRCKYICSS